MAVSPPAAAVSAFISPVSDLTHRIEIYENDGTTRWSNGQYDDRLLGGNVSVDYSRDERRSFDMQLDNSDFALQHSPTGIWYNKVFKTFSGIIYTSNIPIITLSTRTNLCKNPSFETNTTYWQSTGFNGITTPITRDTTFYSGGIASLRVDWTTTALDSIAYSGTDAVEGRKYMFSADVYVPTGSPDVYFGDIYGAYVLYTAKDVWTRLNVVLTGFWNNLIFPGVHAINTTAGQKCWIDKILIEEGTVLGTYFDGATAAAGNHTYAWTGTANNSTSTDTTTVTTYVSTAQSWECQTGEFLLDTPKEDHFPYLVSLSGRDYTKRCMLSKFRTATAYADGTAIETAIKSIAQAAGITKFLLPTTGHALGKDYYFDRGVARWDAMKEIAGAFDYELFFDAQGYLVMRENLDPLTAPLSYILSTGSGGNLVTYSKSLNDSRIYNVVIVTGEASDGTVPASAIATNTEPSSPTRISEIGERVYQYTSAFITDDTQAQGVADSFLKIHALEEFDLDFSSIAFPWLEVGEITQFVDPRPDPSQPDRFLLSSLSLPMGLDAMSGNAKRVSVVG